MGGMGLSRLDGPTFGPATALTVAMWASKEGGAWAGEAEGAGPGAAQVAATRLRVTSAYSGGGGG